MENKISHAIVRDAGGQDKTHLLDVTTTKEQTIRSTLLTAATKTRLRMRKKTVEVPQMHDIDKIVSSHCAETEEELDRTKEVSPCRYRRICPEDCGGASSTVHRQSRGRASGQGAW